MGQKELYAKHARLKKGIVPIKHTKRKIKINRKKEFKMKKTIIGIAILATMLVALIGTTVNAASVTATPSNITVGKEETVTVTVKTDAQISGAVLCR